MRDILEVKVTEAHIDKAVADGSSGKHCSCAIHHAVKDGLGKRSFVGLHNVSIPLDDEFYHLYDCSDGLVDWQNQLMGYEHSYHFNRHKSSRITKPKPKPIIIIFDRRRQRAYVKGEE